MMKLCLLVVLFCSFTSSSAKRLFCDLDGTCDPGYGCREDICRKGESPQLVTTPKPYVPTTTTEEIKIIETTTLPPPIPTEPEPEPETPSPPIPTEAAEPEITLAPEIPTEPQTLEPESELETTTLPFEHQVETDVTTTLSPLTSPSPKPHSASCHTSVNCVYGFWCKKGKCVRKSRRPPSSPHHPTSHPPPHHIYDHQKCTVNTDCHGFRHYCMNGYCIL